MTMLCAYCDKHERDDEIAFCDGCEAFTSSYDPETLDPYISALSVREDDVILTEAWPRSTFGMDCATRGVWF